MTPALHNQARHNQAGRPKTTAAKKRLAGEIVERLAGEYPGSARELCALRHQGVFQLLVATILSAQCTDERVNMVTPVLFATYPTPEALAGADAQDLERLIHSTGFFRSKARNLIAMAAALCDGFGGEVPGGMEELTSLAGVGRKTANVVRSVGMGLPGLPVDTHVGRLVRRLGLTSASDPVHVERDIDELVPPEQRGPLSLQLILHGRAVCRSQTPRCEECFLADLCPSAGDFLSRQVVTARENQSGRPTRTAR